MSLRWGITPSLALSATFNPDFSQIEADALQLPTNQRFALQYGEKRPFFLEGTDIFVTQILAIFTRTVDDPRWGVKLTGKPTSRSALGFFVVEDEVNNLLLPSNAGSFVGRAARPGEYRGRPLPPGHRQKLERRRGCHPARRRGWLPERGRRLRRFSAAGRPPPDLPPGADLEDQLSRGLARKARPAAGRYRRRRARSALPVFVARLDGLARLAQLRPGLPGRRRLRAAGRFRHLAPGRRPHLLERRSHRLLQQDRAEAWSACTPATARAG